MLEVRTIGPITIVLKGQKKNAFISFVIVRAAHTLSIVPGPFPLRNKGFLVNMSYI